MFTFAHRLMKRKYTFNNYDMSKLQKFIYEMPFGMANTFRLRVIDECGISDALFRMWRSGLNVPEGYHDKINSIAMDMFNKLVWEK